MSLAKLPAAGGLVALVLSGCGIAAKPLAGTAHITRSKGNHAQVDDPRTKHAKCLRQQGFSLDLYRVSGGRPAIRVGSGRGAPTVVFEPTPGDAQGLQIVGQAQGAEVIGSALLYPNGGSDSELQAIENCVAVGVTG